MNRFVVILLIGLYLGLAASVRNDTKISSNNRSKEKRDECPFGIKSFLGCFAVDSASQFLTQIPLDDNTVFTADYCACQCGKQGFSHIAMMGGIDCFCGDDYSSGQPEDTCYNQCIDDDTEQCGGNDYDVGSIYETSIGCTPSCGANQTCTNFGGFYWCVPDCDFDVSLSYEIPCGSTGDVTLLVTGTNPYAQQFNVSVDGGALQSGTYNTSMNFTFPTGESHEFTINNIFGCSVNKSVALPIPSLPNEMAAPTPIFDVVTMNLDVLWYKLVYPSYTGGLQLSKYTVQYRHHCPNDTFSNWNTVDALGSDESIEVAFEYGLEYEVKVNAENCLGAGPEGPVTVAVAPHSPYQPLISEISPANGVPTLGGVITLSGKYFTATPTLHANDIVVTPISKADEEIVLLLGAGVGTVKFNVISTANFPCQTLTSPDFTWSYAKPTITNTSVLSNAGGILTITGTNFGASGNVSVGIDDSLCSNCVRTVDHLEIKCTGCPAGNGDGHELKVEVAGLISDAYAFTFAICDPMCVFGECVANNQCSCEDGYGGNDCSEVHVCVGTQAFKESTCGECSQDSSTCCVFKP